MELAEFNAVLKICALFVDRGCAAKLEKSPSTSKVKGQQGGLVRIVFLVACCGALAGRGKGRIADRSATCVYARRIEGRVGQTSAEGFRQGSDLYLYSTLRSVPATGIREVCSQAGARQPPRLRERRRPIGEQLSRGKIIYTVLAYPGVGGEQQRQIEDTGERQPYIKACHVLLLILSCRLLIVSIRDLKPGSGGRHV